jgi:hypothetical protein
MLRQDKKLLKAEEYETQTDNDLMMQLIVHKNNMLSSCTLAVELKK